MGQRFVQGRGGLQPPQTLKLAPASILARAGSILAKADFSAHKLGRYSNPESALIRVDLPKMEL